MSHMLHICLICHIYVSYVTSYPYPISPICHTYFQTGTAALYRVCSTGLRQTQGSPSFHLFKSICVFCVFLFSTPASHSPLVLLGGSHVTPMNESCHTHEGGSHAAQSRRVAVATVQMYRRSCRANTHPPAERLEAPPPGCPGCL